MHLPQAKIRSIIEGLLYLTGEDGLLLEDMKRILPDCSEQEIQSHIETMKQAYKDDEASGLMITDLPEGWRLTTKPFLAAYAEKFTAIPRSATLSQASLETVAIIAYKQPISRIEIDEIRGVKSEKALHTLLAKGLIKEVGRAETTGRAILYGITPVFLDYFGLRSLDDMPPLTEAAKQTSEQLDAYDLFYDKYKETVERLS